MQKWFEGYSTETFFLFSLNYIFLYTVESFIFSSTTTEEYNFNENIGSASRS